MGCKTNNCVKILIYLVISICQCGAQDTSENSVVMLEYGNYTTATYYVELNKSLQIIIKNSHAGYVRCSHYIPLDLLIHKEFPNYDNDSVFNVARVTPEMNTRWRCTIYQRYRGALTVYYESKKNTTSTLYFDVVIKGALSVNASINGEYLYFTRTALNVKHDGETSFHFINGQNIELVCVGVYNYPKQPLEVRIEYFNQNGEQISQVPPTIGRFGFDLIRTKLTSRQDSFYMDCISYTDIPEREYRYRTYFYEKQLNYDPDVQENRIRLSVNGLLQHYVRINDTYLEYPPFAYINGEVITVTCEAERENSNTSLQFYFQEELINDFKVYEGDNKIYAIINSSEKNLEETFLICANINAKKRFEARMSFRSDIEYTDRVFAVGVFGLPRQNLLYQYLRRNTWTTVYEYSANESINLGCVLCAMAPGNYKFQWNFNRGESISNCSGKIGNIEDDNMKYAAENFTRKLTESDNEKVIKCIAEDDSQVLNFAEVKLQLKNTSISENLCAETSYLGLYIGLPIFLMTILLVAIAYVWLKKYAPEPAQLSNSDVNRPQPYYGNEMFQKKPGEGIYILPENLREKEERQSQEVTTIRENVSTTQLDNAVPIRSRYSEPYDNNYSEINYSQCSQPTEDQQRSNKFYNEPYDHCK